MPALLLVTRLSEKGVFNKFSEELRWNFQKSRKI